MNAKANRSLKKLICAGISILFITASAKATLVNANSIVVDNIEYYMQTDKSVYDLGENVNILYKVTNLSENSVDIGMVLMGPWGDFFVTDDDNTDIWQYVRIIPPSGWEMLHMKPYESKEYQITWDMISDNGTFLDHDDDYLVDPGPYNITGELTLSSAYSYKKAPVSVSIEIIPEPCSLVLLGTGLAALLSHRHRRRNSY